jgi:hypothetical protein
MGGQETLLVAQRGSGDTVCYLCKDMHSFFEGCEEMIPLLEPWMAILKVV